MRRTWQYLLTGVIAVMILCCTLLMPETAYAWKTKTHGYSANLLLKDASDQYVTVDGVNYKMPDEYYRALKKYPAAYRAGVLGSDFYPDMLTGQSYIHPYDAKAGLGVGDWLKLLVDGVNTMPKDSDDRLKALAFTLGMATHYAGDLFGHDFVNAFAGGAYPAYADAVQDEDKLFFIIRHMAEETYMDKQIGGRLGSTDVDAPISFILSNWIYNGSANSGPAKIYEKYGGMIYQYQYLVEMRDKLYKFAEKNRPSIVPPVPQIVAYVDAWIDDLDTATYQLAKTFDDIAEDFLKGVKDKNNKPKGDVDIVKDRLNAWLDNYGKYASPTPDWLTKIAGALGKATDWVMEQIGLTALKDKWNEFKDKVVKEALIWGLAQAGIDYYKYEKMLEDPEIALPAHGGSRADYEEYMTYINAFKNNAESFDAFYNTLVMGKLILLGPENLNTFFRQHSVSSSFQNATGHIMMDEFDIKIHTQKGNGTDNNVFVDVYENGKKITTKLLDKPGYDDFESQDTDTYRVELPHRVSPDKFHVKVRFEEVLIHTDSWTTDRIEITCLNNGTELKLDPDHPSQASMVVLNSAKTLTRTGDTISLDLPSKARQSSSLTYSTAVNLGIITFMKSNDNSTQWVNNDNILWNNMTARKNVLYKVFHGFNPKITVSVDKTSFTTGVDANLTATFKSYWNGITKERRDREYLVTSVGESRQKACSGTVVVMKKTNGNQYAPTGLTGTVQNGSVTVNLKTLEPGTYDLCVQYYGDEYNGEAMSDPVRVTVKEPAPCTVEYHVVNGTWADGGMGTITETAKIGQKATNVPTGMKPAEGYMFGKWNKNPYGTVIDEDPMVFTYTFELTPEYPVTYMIEGGTWQGMNGYDGPVSEWVKHGQKPANVPVGVSEDPRVTGDWWPDPYNTVITEPKRFYYSMTEAVINVTYSIVGGTWADGSTDDLIVRGGNGQHAHGVPEGMIPSPGYASSGKWFPVDPRDENVRIWTNGIRLDGLVINPGAIDSDKYTFKYWFDRGCAVTYKIVGGTWADGSAEDIVETVEFGKAPSGVPEGMKALPGWMGGSWDKDPTAVIGKDTKEITYTYTFERGCLVTYKIEEGMWKDGSTADILVTVPKGTKLTDVPTGMMPMPECRGGEWDTDPDGVTVNGDVTFTYFFESMKTYPVTYKIVNGTWADGTTAPRTEYVRKGKSPAEIPENMIANAANAAGSWDTDPVSAIIIAEKTFTWTFEPGCTVTYKVVNGTWADGTTGAKTENVVIGKAPADIPVGMIAASGHTGGSWDKDPYGDTVTRATTYTWTFEALTEHTVTYRVVNGTWADGKTGNRTEIVADRKTPAAVPKGMIAASGFAGGAWDEDPSGAIITRNSVFTWTFEQAKDQAGIYTVTYDPAGWRKNSDTGMEFVVKRTEHDELTFQNYRKLVLDGETLGAGDADVSKGSLKVDLKASKLQTMTVGSHTIKFVFSDGEAEAVFNVNPEKGSFEDIAVPSDTFTFILTGDSESDKSFDFTLYLSDGTAYSHSFGKKKLSDTKWQYTASFEKPIACYIIVKPKSGYSIVYRNTGVYAGIPDRGCDGGTVIFKKIPKTGDRAPLLLWVGMILIGTAAAGMALTAGRRKKG